MSAPIVHPRDVHYPHHRDYNGLEMAYCHHLMFVHRPNYRSRSVNTDRFGLREQYDAAGDFIALDSAARDLTSCSVVVGGSTVLGVDATSDRSTLTAQLTRSGHAWINLGLRGATSQQELQVFLQFKRFLPRIADVIILSGVNNISMAALGPVTIHPDFGGLFSFEYLVDLLYANRKAGTLGSINEMRVPVTWRSRVGNLLGPELRESVRGVIAGARQARVPHGVPAIPTAEMQTRLGHLNTLFSNELETWKCLASGLGFRLHYVLQPCVGWCAKSLTPTESECIEADMGIVPSMRAYTVRPVYEEYRRELRERCVSRGVEFHDANEWLTNAYADVEVFTDVCHLTDRGNELMAEHLRANLPLRS